MTLRQKLEAFLEADYEAYVEEVTASYYTHMAECAYQRAERAHQQAESSLAR